MRAREDDLAARALQAVLMLAVLLFVGLLIVATMVPLPSVPALRLQYMQLYAEVGQTLLAGVVVAVLVVAIPHSLNAAKYRFGRLRASRRAYSEAHTGVTYLPYRLAALDYGAAIALIERVHVRKHIAESYDELAEHLRRKGEDPSHWSDRLAGTLDRLTKEIGPQPERWVALSPTQRVQLLRTAARAERPPA